LQPDADLAELARLLEDADAKPFPRQRQGRVPCRYRHDVLPEPRSLPPRRCRTIAQRKVGCRDWYPYLAQTALRGALKIYGREERARAMKAAEFDYIRVESVEAACRALAGAGGDGKILAGGQTLVPMLAMRLLRPALLVDINRVAGLQRIVAADGEVVIGAGTRQADALANEIVRRDLPLLAKALSFVGHVQTRNRGTIGGSIANADPAAEIALAALALDCEIVAQSLAGRRTIPVAGFFQGAMTTELAADECLIELRFPAAGAARRGCGFHEVNSRHSDFALAAAAVQLGLDGDGACRDVAIAVGGVGGAPLRIDAAAERLRGSGLTPGDIAAAAAVVREAISPASDLHASADYRRRVAGALVERALLDAKTEALAGRA
jgi:CO/xanthine dehydrogenase FAD-binding subunit